MFIAGLLGPERPLKPGTSRKPSAAAGASATPRRRAPSSAACSVAESLGTQWLRTGQGLLKGTTWKAERPLIYGLPRYSNSGPLFWATLLSRYDSDEYYCKYYYLYCYYHSITMVGIIIIIMGGIMPILGIITAIIAIMNIITMSSMLVC